MAIVCGVDFSVWSRNAVHTAAVLAGRWKQPLWLVHALEPRVETMDDSARLKVQEQIEAQLDELARPLESLTQSPVHTSVVPGHADEVLMRVAASKQAMTLVVGSAGHRAASLVRPGSTSERLAVGLSVPLVVVRDDTPFSAWMAGRPFKALVGIDESVEAASALRWVEKLRAVGPVDVVLGRVYYADEAHRRYGLTRRFSFTDPDPAVERLIERDLKQRVPHLPGQGELFYRARLGVGRVADHLLELGEAERCDLVVVGSHGRSGLARMWSVSATTLHLARMAVAIVPSDGQGAGHFVAHPELKRVLVCTDFSPQANESIPWAYALAEPQGEVYLAHVMVTRGLAGDLVETYLPGTEIVTSSKLEAEVAARLRALTPGMGDDKGVVTRTEVMRSSEPGKALVEAAERVGADAIVIASHGRSGLARTMLGSVAEEVMRGSTKPVFVVRGPPKV